MDEHGDKFYVIYFAENGFDRDGRHFEKGYYRFTYSLSGSDGACQRSDDKYRWVDCPVFGDFGSFQDFFEKLDPKPMKLEHEDYIETITYKGISVPVFCDDYGQCFYCIFDNKVMSFGTFQAEYEDCVKDLIDSHTPV